MACGIDVTTLVKEGLSVVQLTMNTAVSSDTDNLQTATLPQDRTFGSDTRGLCIIVKQCSF